MALTRITTDSIQNSTIIADDLANASVNGAKLDITSVSGNTLGIKSVSGNNIGLGAVSGNNIGLGAITSNVLASNLAFSTIRVNETANVTTSSSGPGGTINIDVANNTVYFFGANSTANLSFNLRANTRNTFDSVIQTGQSISVAIAVKHGTNRHTANLLIDGTLLSGYTVLTNQAGPFTANNIIYAGNTQPAYASLTGLYPEVQLFNYTVFKTAANQYTVVASNTIFGIG